MENIAHTLCGLRIADLGWRARIGPAAPWIGAFAANLPDADLLLYAVDADLALWYHRGITHSFAGIPFFALASAALTHRATRRGSFRDHLGLWTAGLVSHALMDWPTTWGTLLFWPLSEVRFALDWIFIVDPMFWALLWLLPTLLRGRWGRARAAAAGLFALAGWILFAGAMQEQAAGQAPERVAAFPSPLAPLFWTGVHVEDDAVRRYWLTLWSAELAGTFPRTPPWADVRIRDTRWGERYFWMARAPAVIEQSRGDGGWTLALSDLAFTNRFLPDQHRFTTEFAWDGERLAVTREGWPSAEGRVVE